MLKMSYKYTCSSPAPQWAVHLHSILLHVTVGIQWILAPVWAADKYSQNTVVAPAAERFVQLISVVIFECRYQHVSGLKLCVKYLQNFHIIMATNYHTRNVDNIIDLHEEAVVWFLHDYACYASCGSCRQYGCERSSHPRQRWCLPLFQDWRTGCCGWQNDACNPEHRDRGMQPMNLWWP